MFRIYFYLNRKLYRIREDSPSDYTKSAEAIEKTSTALKNLIRPITGNSSTPPASSTFSAPHSSLHPPALFTGDLYSRVLQCVPNSNGHPVECADRREMVQAPPPRLHPHRSTVLRSIRLGISPGECCGPPPELSKAVRLIWKYNRN